eukprot:TRINITY_DN62869_c0_g1_i1.p1 TRINITY_DN62869_c0_g1~~TRINITY_DN62869_c0_g1_i1.p1  ORF type:complete len:205 (-),score=12.18 TRINITY_DN62869_c0_g1_i1:709-1296(-)
MNWEWEQKKDGRWYRINKQPPNNRVISVKIGCSTTKVRVPNELLNSPVSPDTASHLVQKMKNELNKSELFWSAVTLAKEIESTIHGIPDNFHMTWEQAIQERRTVELSPVGEIAPEGKSSQEKLWESLVTKQRQVDQLRRENQELRKRLEEALRKKQTQPFSASKLHHQKTDMHWNAELDVLQRTINNAITRMKK